MNLRLRRPAPPAVREYAIQFAERGHDPDMPELLRICVNDPMLAVWILKRANSSYYGMRSTVDSLKRAFHVLGGPAIVRMISGTSGCEEVTSENGKQDRTFFAERSLIRHALATAMITARLAGEKVMGAESAFTAGLLHDIGKHLIFHNFEEQAEGVYGESSLWEQIKGTDLHSVEQLAFGLNHNEAGEYLGRKMDFPEPLTVILAQNSAPDPSTHAPKTYPLLWIVHAASLFSTSTGYAAGKRVSMNCCLENPVWQILVDDQIVKYQKVSALMDVLHSLSDAISNACASSVITTSGPAMNADHAAARNSGSTIRPLSLPSDNEY